MIRHRGDPSISAEELASIEPLRFLYSSYDPKYWYWEVIETFRRIVFTGVLAVMRQGSGLQIVIGFVVSVLFIKLYGHFGEYMGLFV